MTIYTLKSVKLCHRSSSFLPCFSFKLLSLMAIDNERNESPIGAEQDQSMEEIVVLVEIPQKLEL